MKKPKQKKRQNQKKKKKKKKNKKQMMKIHSCGGCSGIRHGCCIDFCRAQPLPTAFMGTRQAKYKKSR